MLIVPPPTQQEEALTQQEQTLKYIRGTVTGCYAQMKAAVANCQMLVFRNPFGLAPQAVLDGLGADAASLFTYAADIVTLLNKAGVDAPITSVVPEGVTVTINPNETVTLGEAALVEETPAPAPVVEESVVAPVVPEEPAVEPTPVVEEPVVEPAPMVEEPAAPAIEEPVEPAPVVEDVAPVVEEPAAPVSPPEETPAAPAPDEAVTPS